MRDPNLPAATLVIGRYNSRCNACGQECNPHDDIHNIILGYEPGNGDAGCGIAWQYVTTNYLGADDERLTRAMRPDLEFIPPV